MMGLKGVTGVVHVLKQLRDGKSRQLELWWRMCICVGCAFAVGEFRYDISAPWHL